MFQTMAYKNAYIHISSLSGITVQDQNFKLYKVKSVRAAKLLITKKLKGGAE